MIWCILKLSYNNIWYEQLEWWICWTCFICDWKMFTANHLLNKNTFKPNLWYNYCNVYVLIDNKVIWISNNDIIEYSDIDTTIINFDVNYEFSSSFNFGINYNVNDECYNEWFIGSSMPILKSLWNKNELLIKWYNLSNNYIDSSWLINIDGKSNDVNFKNKEIIWLSYWGVIWMSWWPLIHSKSWKVIWIMSFWTPEDKPSKDFLFSISSKEILLKIK